MRFMYGLRRKREKFYWFLQNRKPVQAFAMALLQGELSPHKPYNKPVWVGSISVIMQFAMLVRAVERLSKKEYTVRVIDRNLTASRDDAFALCRSDLLPAELRADNTLALEQKVPNMLPFAVDDEEAVWVVLLPDSIIARNARTYSRERSQLRRAREKEAEQAYTNTIARIFAPEFAKKIASIRHLMRLVRDRAVLEDVLMLLKYTATMQHQQALGLFFTAERVLLHALQEQNAVTPK